MANLIRAWGASEAGGKLEPISYKLGTMGPEEVEIEVIYCGLCHSDLSMLNNDWGQTEYPFVGGHEVVGRVVEAGNEAKRVKNGDIVGLGWFSGSCVQCPQCMGGDHNLCPEAEQTIVHRHGGFAERVRCHWSWAIPIPEEMDYSKVGPLFCGGITVFSPIVEFEVKPTDRVGVVGIGGLGHLALQFLNAWGCEVYAFTSSESKREEAKKLGAHHTVDSTNPDSWESNCPPLDFVLVTANVPLEWSSYLKQLAPKGKLHFVGAVPEPLEVQVFELLPQQKSISASPLGSPETVRKMLEFCQRHDIAPKTELFPMSKINEAIEHLEAGKARYRVVLEADFDQ